MMFLIPGFQQTDPNRLFLHLQSMEEEISRLASRNPETFKSMDKDASKKGIHYVGEVDNIDQLIQEYGQKVLQIRFSSSTSSPLEYRFVSILSYVVINQEKIKNINRIVLELLGMQISVDTQQSILGTRSTPLHLLAGSFNFCLNETPWVFSGDVGGSTISIFGFSQLIKTSKNINVQDARGRTPLFYAACGLEKPKAGHLSMIGALLDRGADPLIFDNSGVTPEDVLRLRERNIIYSSDYQKLGEHYHSYLKVILLEFKKLVGPLREYNVDRMAKDLPKLAQVIRSELEAVQSNKIIEAGSLSNPFLYAQISSNDRLKKDRRERLIGIIGKFVDWSIQTKQELQTHLSFHEWLEIFKEFRQEWLEINHGIRSAESDESRKVRQALNKIHEEIGAVFDIKDKKSFT